MSYSNPLLFRPATISAGRGTYLRINLNNNYYYDGILGLDEFEFTTIPETAHTPSWEGILGGGKGAYI